MKNKTLFSQIWQVASSDDLRPDLQQVYFWNGFAYCTNATVGIRQSLDLWKLEPEQREILNGKAIPAESLKKASKDSFLLVHEDGLSTETGQIFRYYENINEDFRKNVTQIMDDLFLIYADEISPVKVWPFFPDNLLKLSKSMQYTGKEYLIAFLKDPKKPLIFMDSESQDITMNAGFIFPVLPSTNYENPEAWGGIEPARPEKWERDTNEPENEPENENERAGHE
jgi:hypothetical protein